MIVYAVICRSRDVAVLVENYSPELSGNAPQVTMALMERLRDHPEFLPNGQQKTFAQRNESDDDGNFHFDFFPLRGMLEACTGGGGGLSSSTSTSTSSVVVTGDHFFHVLHDGTVYFTCLSDDPNPRSHQVCLQFLKHVRDEFRSLYKERRIDKVNAYGLDKDFGPHLRSAMHYYNTNRDKLQREAKVDELMVQVESMKTIMGRNITLLLQRGENLEMLVDKSNQAMDDTAVFKKQSRQLKTRMRWQYYKNSCLLAFLIVGVLWICLSCICGFNFARCIPDDDE